MTREQIIAPERLREIAAEYGELHDTLKAGPLIDGPGAVSAFYGSLSVGEVVALASIALPALDTFERTKERCAEMIDAAAAEYERAAIDTLSVAQKLQLDGAVEYLRARAAAIRALPPEEPK